MMELSAASMIGTTTPKTISFEGFFGQVPIRILLDSGSTHTFVSTSIADSHPGKQKLLAPMNVQVANGQMLICSEFILDDVWSIQGIPFQSNLKILPMSSYDMILGMDWLSVHSPMRVHWEHQWLQIPHPQGIVQLEGTLSTLPEGTLLQLIVLEANLAVTSPEAPLEVQQLLQQFAAIFEPPETLPLHRGCEHAIPL